MAGPSTAATRAARIGIDAIQLHGAEAVAPYEREGRRIIKSVAVHDDFDPVVDHLCLIDNRRSADDLDHVVGHRQVADAYLVSLARTHSATLATLDAGLASSVPRHTVLLPVS